MNVMFGRRVADSWVLVQSNNVAHVTEKINSWGITFGGLSGVMSNDQLQ